MVSRSVDFRIKFSLCYLNRRLGDWEISGLGKARKKIVMFFDWEMGDQVISRLGNQ